MRGIIIALTFFAIGLLSCNKKTLTSSFAQKEGYVCEQNESAEYALCKSRGAEGKTEPSQISYYISDKSGAIVYEGSIDSGNVQWLDDNAIQIFQPPGMMSTQQTKEDLIKVYVISDGKMMSKSSYIN